MRILSTTIMSAVLLMTACASDTNKNKAVGDWHGQLDTGSGKLTLIVTIKEDGEGTLSGVLETPDQAPGTLILITTVMAQDDHLHLDLQTIAAVYDGDWNAPEKSWFGVWKQSGVELPLKLEPGRPAPPAIVEGMDGIWEGSVTRKSEPVQLIISIETKDGATRASFASPTNRLKGIPVKNLERRGNSVRFSVPATGSSYQGLIAEDGASMTGIWKYRTFSDEVTFVLGGDQ
jgi:hypothetical protein